MTPAAARTRPIGCLFEVPPRRLPTLAMLADSGLPPEPLDRVGRRQFNRHLGDLKRLRNLWSLSAIARRLG
jgi:hypothetical protein